MYHLINKFYQKLNYLENQLLKEKKLEEIIYEINDNIKEIKDKMSNEKNQTKDKSKIRLNQIEIKTKETNPGPVSPKKGTFNKKHTIDVITDIITNPLKLVVNFFEITAGNTIKLEINNVPIILIPRTTTKAVNIEINN